MLRRALATCRHGCKYKGEGCLEGSVYPSTLPRLTKLNRPIYPSTLSRLNGVPHSAVVRSQVYQESLARCARANKQEIEEPLLVEADGRLEELRVLAPRSGNRTSSIARTGGCGS